MMGSIAGSGFNDLTGLGLTPAMITALFHKPHDRQFVVELENSVASFVASNAESYELRPMNSYYRLLSHQVAEYHNLKHALARTQDNCVIIFKGDGFENIQGKPLLQNLQPMGLGPYGCTNTNASNTTNNKRYRILKRRDGQSQSDKIGDTNTDTPNNNNNNVIKPEAGQQGADNKENDEDTNASLEQQRLEKEKQYEQRKQEIFSTPKKNSDDDDDNDNDNEEENGTSDNNSPQPYQFETSRYRFNDQATTQQNEPNSQTVPHRQQDYVSGYASGYTNGNTNGYTNGYTNGHINGNANGNGRRHRKHHPFDNDPRRNSSNTTPQYHMPYFMYPTPPMAAANTSQPPSQFPIMYPAPFPVDGANGYMAPVMYQPIPGFGPMGPKASVTPTSAPAPGPYMTYPFPYHYGQPQAPPPTPPSSTMYRQFSTPQRSHGPRYQKYSRNSSRSSFSRRSSKKQNSQDDTIVGHSSTSTMESGATEIDELSENMQKLI
ncbi:ZYRO0F05676p [Zygosaccharomyces rouxii]|uniref:ZYRO0F05676p n=1 Tax=Zygosaccharomyces rouxii (strain ATCC 2623 / CBS 732 / NBRC 1130 / NCYC 568 / NRRL Y-229) TaxID=559307 RepID=C5DXJ9_ZYGRC|nr:uncharacterized protein ZYRO0F05676g [Zygosaccharomyces rouxii]KAH9199272.1 hypothetical protein LQ764DRAFT_235132 [Zygosaccharomyces rouxii]CAR28510.1 ZYRO0F05676p [Zygosaccharomyces rouxii]